MNNRLAGFSDDDLREELERRRIGARPQPIKNPDFGPLIKVMQEGMQAIENTKQLDDDFDHYVWEEAMTCLYGPDVFKWINKVCP